MNGMKLLTLVFALFYSACKGDCIPVLNMLTLDKNDNFGHIVKSVTNISLEQVDRLYGQFFKINYTFTSAGDRCTPKRKMTTIAEAHFTTGIDVLMGPVCGSDIEIVACMASSWNIPIISPSGSSARLTDKTEFTTLTNMAFTMEKFATFYMNIYNEYQWKDIALLFDDDSSLLDLLARSLHSEFRKSNFTTFLLPFQDKSFRSTLREASKYSRVFATVCTADDFREIMLTAQSLDMTSGDYVYLYIRFYEVEKTEKQSWKRGDKYDKAARSAYDSVLVVQPSSESSAEFKDFVQRVKIRTLDMYNYAMRDDEVNIFMMAFYDSINIYSKIINETLAEGGDIRDGGLISNKMKGRTFDGISGKVFMDDNGDRKPNFQMLDMDRGSGEFVVVADYFGSSSNMVFRNDVIIYWPGNDGPPKNIPFCGFMGDNPACKKHVLNTTGIVAGVLAMVIVGVTVGCLFIYRRIKQETDLKSQWWDIKNEDLVFTSQLKGSRRSKLSMLMSTDEIRSLRFDRASTTDFISDSKMCAYYKGGIVSLIKTKVTNVTMTRNLLKEFKQMKDIHCTNLARFIGVYRTPKDIFIVMEHCTRGSLQDILQNDSLDLDWDFKAALLTDLTNGMTYLHNSSILVHGRLNSERCMIDSRFVVKISDYGLPSIFGKDALKSVDSEKEYLWVAPECLRGNKASQASDVYSFGMIMYEVLTRMSPFEMETGSCTISDIVKKIKENNGKSFRPSLPTNSDKPKIVDLMKACWDEIAFKRPTFRSIKKQLKEITRISAGHNILDALLRRMEQYAGNLEELVGQRTEAFLEEKKKSDLLLEQLLPRTVADKLKNNQLVDPEAYESVTIYFSDIVGFTMLSAESSPMEIVDLLNDLYCLFDAIIERYDVYKVETIGDAYMVVSGLPHRNGNKHVCEISRMSLEIVRNVGAFRVRHLADRGIQTRIGIHSGSVCAGVVGTKMPRYCLFGDTVNTASRMESHGQAMKIHVSPDTKALLDQHSGFQLEMRGNIEIKGKGLMTTYWLTEENERIYLDPNNGGVKDRKQVTNVTGNDRKQVTNVTGNDRKQVTNATGNDRKQVTNVTGNDRKQVTNVTGNDRKQVTNATGINTEFDLKINVTDTSVY